MQEHLHSNLCIDLPHPLQTYQQLDSTASNYPGGEQSDDEYTFSQGVLFRSKEFEYTQTVPTELERPMLGPPRTLLAIAAVVSEGKQIERKQKQYELFNCCYNSSC